MRAVSLIWAGRSRAILFAVLAALFVGWLVLSTPTQLEHFTAGSNPDAGMQLADPGWGGGGG